MSIPVKSRYSSKLSVFWDSGSTISLVRNSKARDLKLKGIPVTMNITTVGGIERAQPSFKYRVSLVDRSGRVKMITAYGIDIIANVVTSIHSEIISSCFNEDELKDCNRPCGSIDLLIGFEYAAWHPVQIEAREHLLVLSNVFGKCIAGSPCKGRLIILLMFTSILHHCLISLLSSRWALFTLPIVINAYELPQI